MKKILVLGASGMAGHVTSLYLRENGFKVDTLTASKPLDKDTHLIDVTEKSKFEAYLSSNTYDVVVNCIGVLVKQSEERKDLAVYINSYLPRFLENYYKNKETKVIHLSTDGVFSSHNPPYIETSSYDTHEFYGRTKALGEIINTKDLTFRMSIIGPDMSVDGIGLFNWFYSQKGEIKGYANVVWNGITTIELAKGIEAAINQNLTGLYHLVPQAGISKFKLLELFKEVFSRKDINIEPIESPVGANRTLTITRKDFDYEVPEYKGMITEMKSWIDNHPSLYRHYSE
jgi:dTDP-4-dehydrorhamnose reductase